MQYGHLLYWRYMGIGLKTEREVIEMDKHWWASKTIWVQFLGLLGMVLIGSGLIGEASWPLYLGIVTQVIGIIIRFVTKGGVVW